MKAVNILFITVLIALNANGQKLKEAAKALKKINSIEQIDALKTEHPEWNISDDITLYSDSNQFPNIILMAKVGDIVVKQYNPQAPTYVAKIIKDQDVELCKVKYIYLNGSKLSALAIDSIRTQIIDRYRNGEDFEDLVKIYTMDKNPTGDLGWFYKGMMVEDFDSAVRGRKKGEIFTVDVIDNKWYYVVLKTYDNKVEKAKLAVKIKYDN